jgi:transposase
MDAEHSSPPPAAAAAADPAFVGIDVSKDALDLARSDDAAAARVERFANDADGIASVVRSLTAAADARPAMIVVEATGGFERPLVDALLDAGLGVALVHPGRVRQFARGLGVLAKTDRVDARVLARFGRLAAPRLAERRSKNLAELQALVACRRQLTVTRVQQSNRLGATASKPARKAIEAVAKTLDKQLEKLDKQIRELVDADDDFKHLDGLLQSVPGVGQTLSATLAAELRELGDVDRKQVGALAGVAPFNRDSGARCGPRSTRGGRVTVRCVLYMATVAAIRCNPVIRAFSDRLKEKGKVSKVRIVACMRKLLTLLNAMVRDGLTWDQLDVVKKLAA